MFYDLNIPVTPSSGSTPSAQDQLETRKRVELLAHCKISTFTSALIMPLACSSRINYNRRATSLNPVTNAREFLFLSMIREHHSGISGCRIQQRDHRENATESCKWLLFSLCRQQDFVEYRRALENITSNMWNRKSLTPLNAEPIRLTLLQNSPFQE